MYNSYSCRLIYKCFVFVGRCCAMFDYGVGRVIEDYDKLCSECPFNYNSTESFFCEKHSFFIQNTSYALYASYTLYTICIY